MTGKNTPSPAEQRYQLIRGKVLKAKQVSPFRQEVTLIAVSKTQPVEAIAELYEMGQRDFGENYVQELIEKAEELSRRGCKDIRWHFIGHLQTNKVKSLLPYVAAVHTLDSEKLALKLAKRWEELGNQRKLPVFVEVNLDRETTKSGVPASEVVDFLRNISSISELKIQGLMCIPAPGAPASTRFVVLRELEKECRPTTCGMLSMGMSEDFEVAIREGATHVRVGTALFGPRKLKLAENLSS